MWRLVLTVSLLCCSSEASVTCKNENNGEVDWFIIYKAPKQANKLTGLEFFYIDSAGQNKYIPDPKIKFTKLIDDPDGVLAKTLRPLFIPVRRMPPTFGFISYSDQPPGSHAHDTFGHSKGVVMVEKDVTGVWEARFKELTSRGDPADGYLYVTIAQKVQSDLKVQTWGCQKDRAKSYCGGGFKVYIIDSIKTCTCVVSL